MAGCHAFRRCCCLFATIGAVVLVVHEDEVILAEGLQLVDGEDVQGKRRGVAIKIEAVIYNVLLLEVSDYGGPQWHKFPSSTLAATFVAKGGDAVGEAPRRRGRADPRDGCRARMCGPRVCR